MSRRFSSTDIPTQSDGEPPADGLRCAKCCVFSYGSKYLAGLLSYRKYLSLKNQCTDGRKVRLADSRARLAQTRPLSKATYASVAGVPSRPEAIGIANG